jgi:hypothetical protein
MEQRYRSAVVALEAEEWDKARSELRQLRLGDERYYKDARTLLLESYYRPAMLAIDRGQWEDAAKSIREIIKLDFEYEDTVDLVAARPELRRALSTASFEVFANQDWQNTGIYVFSGENVTIRYMSGAWAPSGSTKVDADGVPNSSSSTANYLAGHNHASLIGRGRTNSGISVFFVGKINTIKANEEGVLELRINDKEINDNPGSIVVLIEVK